MIIIPGSSNLELAHQLVQLTDSHLAHVELSKFPNGENRVWVKTDLKNQRVAVLQSFSKPVDDHIIEFTLLVDAAKNLGAKEIIAVIPWLGYSPQDKEFRKGEPISVSVIAKIIQAVGVTSLVTVDIHSIQSLNHFEIPTKHLSALPLFIEHWQPKITPDHIAIVLDKGAQSITTQFAKKLNLPLAIFHKQRDKQSGSITLKLVSGQVKDKHGIALDDFTSTGSTRITASKILKNQGLLSYHDCITHAIMAGDAIKHINHSHIDSVLVTNTYPIPPEKQIPKLQITSIAPIIADALLS